MGDFEDYIKDRGAVLDAPRGRRKAVCVTCGKYREIVSRGRCDTCRKAEDGEARSGLTKYQKTRLSVFHAIMKQCKRLEWPRSDIAMFLQQPKLKVEFDCVRQYIQDDATLAREAVGEVDGDDLQSTQSQDVGVDTKERESTQDEMDAIKSQSTPDATRRVDGETSPSTRSDDDEVDAMFERWGKTGSYE